MTTRPAAPGSPVLIPGPNPAYALGARAGGLLFLALHVGGDGLGNGREASLEQQVHQAFGRLFQTLERAGLDRTALVKLNVHLSDVAADFAAYDAIYRALIPEPRPPRTTIQTPIGHGWRFGVDGVALASGA